MVGVGDWLGVQQLMAVRVLGSRHARCTAADGYGAGSLEPDTVNVGEPDSTRLQPAIYASNSGDINAPGDKFVTRSSTTNPGGIDGVAVLFVNQDDTRAIGDTILVCAMARYTEMYAIHQNVDASDDSACWPTRCDHAG